MIDNRIVGKKISTMRQENGLTQQQLAAMMNVSHQAVSKWESGQTLPDIQTMLELTRFFGITVEQLISQQDNIEKENEAQDVYQAPQMMDTNVDDEPAGESEVKNMSIQQLLQMAPYMSKETVEEIANEIEERISAQQLARLAPYIRAECLENLMEKHRPELTWESLRRIAPYLRREYVDGLARNVASGKETIRPSGENINKAFNDIGRAIDDFGHDMKHVVKKGLRFGKNVIREVSSALSDFSADNDKADIPVEPVRSERMLALRKKAFERALADEKWEWIAQHIGELENDADFRGRIAQAAREKGMNDWICEYMGSFAGTETIEAAISAGNWEWLGDNARLMDTANQEKIARAAMQAGNWQWIRDFGDRLCLTGCGLETAEAALKAGEGKLAVRIAENHLLPDQVSALAEFAYSADDFSTFDMLLGIADDGLLEKILPDMATNQKWQLVEKYLDGAKSETLERLIEIAVELGDFDAVDMLDEHF